MSITIYHNPSCGTSRNTLAMIRQSGEEPEIIEYLKAPPTREHLIELLRAMHMRPRELLRRKDTPYAELRLDDPKWTDDEAHRVAAACVWVATRKAIPVRPTGMSASQPPMSISC
jgi:arsenate reductase (glutaredoxin)